MKKFLFCGMIAALVLCALQARGEGFYSRGDGAAPLTTGVSTFTNSRTYEPIELKRIWVYASPVSNNVVTVSRVDYGGAITQACGSVATANLLIGNSATFTAAYLQPGDYLTLTSSLTTGFSYRIEYEIQGLK